MASSSFRVRSSIRRLAVAGLGGALGLLGACGQSAPGPGQQAGRANDSQRLIAEPEHYVGAASLAPKQLALTFDDGPAERTAELSTYLKEQGIRAVFFVNGGRIQASQLPNPNGLNPLNGAAAVLAQLTADGHLVANHSTTHRDITSVPANQRVQEVAETDTLITTLGGTPWNRSLFRAPYGAWSAAVHPTVQASTMQHYVGPIYWDIGGFHDRYPNTAADWACFGGELSKEGGGLVHSGADPIPDGYATTEECGNAYRAEITAVGRGIVLMHEPYGWSENGVGGHTVDMVKYLVPLLKADGYTFVRADEVPIIAADLPKCAAAGCVSCSGPGADQCTGCEPGSFVSGGSCVACSACAAGTYASGPCSAGTTTVCTPCAPDTYALAGATACVSCGGCDDGDACTTDTCSATTGCVHAPIAGCGGPGSSGSSGTSGGGVVPGATNGGESGCQAGTGPSSLTMTWPLALFGLALLRRRRARDIAI